MNEHVNSSSEYLAKELDYLRGTFLELRKETRALETYALLAVGAIWSWYATDSNSSRADHVLWLPHIVTVLFGIRAAGVYMQMRTTRKYLEKLELSAKLPEGLGWEKFLNQDWTRAIWPTTAIAFWVFLIFLTGFGAFFLQ